jgi:hypothetical protein
MICRERITITAYSETYCMLPAGHKGPHNMHPDSHPQPQPKESPKDGVARPSSAHD